MSEVVGSSAARARSSFLGWAEDAGWLLVIVLLVPVALALIGLPIAALVWLASIVIGQ